MCAIAGERRIGERGRGGGEEGGVQLPVEQAFVAREPRGGETRGEAVDTSPPEIGRAHV